MADQLIEFIFKRYSLQLSSIVIDFIKDTHGIEYFIGVKSFKVNENKLKPVEKFSHILKETMKMIGNGQGKQIVE